MSRLLLIVLALLTGLAAQARALESAPAVSPRATVSLVTDADAVSPGTTFRIGLWFRLAPGWHTYWRNPGDAGVAPELDLALPKGATAGPLAWPAPQRVREGPVMTYAYTGEVLLPLTMTLGPDAPTPGAGPATVPPSSPPRRAGWCARTSACRSRPTSPSLCRRAVRRPDRPPLGPGQAVRRGRAARPAPLALASAYRAGRHALAARRGTRRRHRDRCLVHPRDRRHRSRTPRRSCCPPVPTA